MQSGVVNASQLLAAFLGSAKDKIGQDIAKNDFSGELKKHLPQKANGAGLSAGQTTAAGKTDASDVGAKASTVETPVSSEAKNPLLSSIQETKGMKGSDTKIKAIESKAKEKESLFVSNPAVVETVLANLHYSAATRKACKDLLNEHGRIPLKDLKSILDTRPEIGSDARAEVPAASVGALVGSIVDGSAGAKGKGQDPAGGSFKSSVQIKTEGSYSRDELRGLLKKVLQAAETQSQQTQSAGLTSQPAPAETAAQGMKGGQTESLVATVLPSFISTGHKVTAGKIFTENSSGPGSEVQSAKGKGTDVRENSTAGVSDSSESGGRTYGADKVAPAGGDCVVIPLSAEAGIQGPGNGSSKASASALSPEQEKPAYIPAEGLDLALKFGDRSKPGQLEESASAATGTVSLKNVESNAALGGQDTTMLSKQIEKQVGSGDASESAASRTLDPGLHDNGINLPRMDNSARDGFAFYDPYKSAELVKNMRGAKTADVPKAGQTEDLTATILSSSISTDYGIGPEAKISAGNSGNPKSEAQSAKRADAGGDYVQKGSDNLKSEGQQGAEKIVRAAGDLEGTARGVDAGINGAVNGSPLASASAWPVAQQAVSVPADALDPASNSGDGSDPGQPSEKSASERVSAAIGTGSLKTVEGRAALAGQASKMLESQIEKKLGSKDYDTETAVLQSSASSLHGGAINPPLIDSSAQNGFAMHDPYLAAEFAQNMREQVGSGAGSQLVLEMEPDGLGKINIKVGARKDEISVVAMTQDEPARQALMSHSVELRQDLRNQGLVLGKFMVDVNGGRAGGGRDPEAYRAGGRERRPSKTAKVRNVQSSDVPGQVVKTSIRSQISIFA